MRRAKVDLEEGILTKYRVLRTKQLEGLVSENCYSKKSYTYLEAEQCDEFHFKNDYKLNLISTFWKDHAPKHILSHKSCLTDIGLEQMETIAEKDRAYADCHSSWVKDFKEVQSQDLEARARNLFGKNLEA